MRTKATQTISFSTPLEKARKKLDVAMARLNATDLHYGHAGDSSGDYTVKISFKYKEQKYVFEYSRKRAEYYGYRYPQDKDVMIAVILAISDLAKIADRGVFDFGKLAEGFKELPLITVPSWAKFMGFQTQPRNIQEVRSRYNELVKGSMRPETNPEDFRELQKAWELAQQFFGVV